MTHGGGGGSVHVDGTAHVRPHGVDGGVGAEARRVDPQVGCLVLHLWVSILNIYVQLLVEFRID